MFPIYENSRLYTTVIYDHKTNKYIQVFKETVPYELLSLYLNNIAHEAIPHKSFQIGNINYSLIIITTYLSVYRYMK